MPMEDRARRVIELAEELATTLAGRLRELLESFAFRSPAAK